MKAFPFSHLLLFLALAFAPSCLLADEAADAAWQQLLELDQRSPDPAQRPVTEAAFVRWNEARLRLVLDASLKFYDEHPDDPRRWAAVGRLLVREPAFVANYLPAFEKNPTPSNATIDEAAKAAWLVRRARLIAEILATPSADTEAREAAFIASIYDRLERDENIPTQEAEQLLRSADKEFRDSRRLPQLVAILMRGVEQRDPAGAERIWAFLKKARNREVRKVAEGKNRLIEAWKKPLRLSFTAFDGRNVDFDDLRGKVVLIVFWAMWNGPSLTELPNLKKVYAAYHERGFEIVGVSLDGAKDGDKLKLFLAENQIPWPQFFDGKGWKNRLAVKYAVTTAPSMLLLDKSGRLISTHARGPKLDETVRAALDGK